MKSNIGRADRWIRVIIGLGIMAVGFTFKSWWGLLGLLPLATAAIGYCGMYTVCGLTTCTSRQPGAPPTS